MYIKSRISYCIIKYSSSLLLCWFLLFGIGCQTNVEQETPTIGLSKTHYLNLLNDDDFIVEFEFDKNGVLWIGTFNGGIHRITDKGTTVFDTSNSSLPDNRINDIFIDHLNRVWVATFNGYATFENEQWRASTVDNSPLLIPFVSEISVNTQNEILLGNGNATEGGLLFRNRNGVWKSFTTENSDLACNIILDIELTEDDGFWVGTGQFLRLGAIIKFENETITEILSTENTELLYNNFDYLEINDDELWVGFEVNIFNVPSYPDGGIQRVNPASFTTENFFPNKTIPVSNRVSAMKLHTDNSLWFATVIDDPYCENCNSGLGMINKNGEMTTISGIDADFSTNAFFTHLNEDNNGNMYVSYENALYRLELQ